jgi:hypothetical protein
MEFFGYLKQGHHGETYQRDMEFLLMDGTIVKAHQHAAGAKKK